MSMLAIPQKTVYAFSTWCFDVNFCSWQAALLPRGGDLRVTVLEKDNWATTLDVVFEVNFCR